MPDLEKPIALVVVLVNWMWIYFIIFFLVQDDSKPSKWLHELWTDGRDSY